VALSRQTTEEGIMKKLVTGLIVSIAAASFAELSYPIVDTGQIRCYDDRTEISFPTIGRSWFGQDAQYAGNQPAYRNNGDGTVTDVNTGLMWQSEPGEKITLTFASQTVQTTADQFGRWKLTLNPMPHSSQGHPLIARDSQDTLQTWT